MTGQSQQHAHWDVIVQSPDQTERLAAHLGAIVEPGAVIVLDGDLGAGKTTFVRGLARGMGLGDTIVSSPTFTLIHEYDGDMPLYHFDTYRLDDPSQFADLGAEEYLAGRGVCAIEWGGRVRSELPPERLELVFTSGLSGGSPGGSPPDASSPGRRGGVPLTHGCGGAEHWHMTEADIEPKARRIAFHPLGRRPLQWVIALKQAWLAAEESTPSPVEERSNR